MEQLPLFDDNIWDNIEKEKRRQELTENLFQHYYGKPAPKMDKHDEPKLRRDESAHVDAKAAPTWSDALAALTALRSDPKILLTVEEDACGLEYVYRNGELVWASTCDTNGLMYAALSTIDFGPNVTVERTQS